MTREEKIISEAKKCYSENIKCYDAFLYGVDFADEHPKNVWHNASEEPEGNNWRILFQDEEGECWVEHMGDMVYSHNTWDEYIEIEMVVKWAYISDLLPKEGGAR